MIEMGIKSRSEQGFTLLEVLMAVTIAGIILSGVFIFVNMGLTDWRRTTLEGEWKQQWRVFDKIFRRDLHNVFISPLDQENMFEGDYQSLQWKVLTEDGVQKIKYFFDPDLNLVIKEYSLVGVGIGNHEIHFFADQIMEGVNFSYYDGKSDYWTDDWSYQERDYLPTVVKMTLKVLNEEPLPLIMDIPVGIIYQN